VARFKIIKQRINRVGYKGQPAEINVVNFSDERFNSLGMESQSIRALKIKYEILKKREDN
jgi:hypothetical protein